KLDVRQRLQRIADRLKHRRRLQSVEIEPRLGAAVAVLSLDSTRSCGDLAGNDLGLGAERPNRRQLNFGDRLLRRRKLPGAWRINFIGGILSRSFDLPNSQ